MLNKQKPGDCAEAAQEAKQLYANIGKLVTSSLKQEEIFRGIMDEVRAFFRPQNWSLLRVDETTQELFFVIAEGLDHKLVRQIRLQVGEGVAGHVAQTGQSLYVPDAQQFDKFSRKVDELSGFTTHSLIAVPIRFHDKTYGIIEIVNPDHGGKFTEDEHLILQTIGDFSAIAFANAALYNETLNLAQNDPLTGVYNRNRLNKMIAKWHPTHERREETNKYFLTLALIDLDNFKEINDTLGHQTGDNVLIHITTKLKKMIRSQDSIFRIGGDEFLLAMPTRKEKNTNKLEQRLEQALKRLQGQTNQEDPPYSFSFGIKSGQATQFEKLFHNVDQKMYHYKKR